MSTSTGPEAPTDWSALEDRALLAAHVEGREGAFAELFDLVEREEGQREG